jgi:hypothetical protein
MKFSKSKKVRSHAMKRLYESTRGLVVKDQTWRKIMMEVKRRCEHPLESDEFAMAVWQLATERKFREQYKGIKGKEIVQSAAKLTHLIKGDTHKEYLNQVMKHFDVNPPRSTKYWFFRPLGGYDADKQLKPDEKLLIATKVLQWKLNNEEYNNEQLATA